MLSRQGIILALLMTSGCQSITAVPEPIIDVHLHYNPDQAEITDIPEALDRLRNNGVIFGIVSSKPPALALKLADASGGWIIPFYMPYLEPGRKADWFFDERVLSAARVALESGRYKGLGEIHLIAGLAPSLKTPQPTIDGMLNLAEEFNVPIVIHAEASSHLYFVPLCQRHPETRILWAHAGSPLRPVKVRKLMQACPNVWFDISARDHMRYGKTSPIVDDEGHLLPDWHDLVLEFQDRIMIGSDPTYYEGEVTWDEPNTGWNYLGEVLEFHRHWLKALPDAVRQKIMLQNAWQLFSTEAADALRPNARMIAQ